jgi:hypothetical protein
LTKGLLINSDAQVAAWAFSAHNRIPMHVDKALGIVEDGTLTGAVLFTNYNGIGAELSYYGRNTATLGIFRTIARIALFELHLVRCTVIVPKRPSYLIKKLGKFGFRYEGIQRRHYGPTDSSRHTGYRFVLFKEDMEKLAALVLEKVA